MNSADNCANDAFADLFEAVAEGRSLDWSEVERRGGQALVDRLVALQRLLHAFAEVRNDAAGVAADVLFGWGHLQVVEEIGRGSSSVVYRAYDTILEREVALKLQHPQQTDGSNAASFIAEARRIARVRHPAVLAVLGAAAHDDRPGLWTDLLNGRTLQQELAARGAFAPAEVLQALETLADALYTVHAANLVHGDVKAANVMLTDTNQWVLMDFGAGGEAEGLLAGASAGSPASMAPEVFAGARSGREADLYALGVLGYQLLAGQPPLRANTLDELTRLVADHSRQVRLALTRIGDRGLRGLLSTLLATTPEHRPTASVLRERLAWLRGAPARNRRRLRWLLLAAVLSAATLISAASYFSAQRAFENAQANYQRAEQVNRFLNSLLGSGNGGSREPNIRVLDMLDPAAAEAEAELAGSPAALASVLAAVARSFVSLGQAERAMPLLQRSLALTRAQQPLDRNIERATRLTIARARRETGQSEQARSDLDTLLAELEPAGRAPARLPVEASILADAYNMLGELAEDGGQTADAEAQFSRCIDILQQLPDSRDRLRAQLDAYTSRGGARRQLGQLAAAEADYQTGLALVKGVFPANAGDVLAAKNGLGVIASLRGEHRLAEALYREVLAASAPLDPAHGNRVAAGNNLALAIAAQGRYAEAAEHFQTIVALYPDFDARRPGSPERIQTVLTARANLASMWRLLGRTAEAIALSREVQSDKWAVYGERHPETLLTDINLAELLVEAGQVDAGASQARAAESTATELFGAMHPFTQEAREVLALAQMERGEPITALAALQSVLEAKNALYGESSSATQSTRLRLAEAYRRLQQSAPARELLVAVLQQREIELGKDHPDTAVVRESLDRLDRSR